MVLGSGTATSLIVSNIAAAGGLPVALGLSVLLGADVGSALTTAIFASGSSFLKQLAPLLVFAGYIVFSLSREPKPHNVGRMLIGVGLMLFALQLISQTTQPLNAASLLHAVLSALSREPVLAFVAGALLAWSFHSTLAAILLVSSLAGNDSLTLPTAAAFILGINLGGGLPAVLGALSLPREARQLPVANLFCRGLLCAATLPLIPWLTEAAADMNLTGLPSVLALHLAINVAAALVWLPLAGLGAAISARLLPNTPEPPDPLGAPRYLSLAALETPAVALSNAALETTRMSEVLDRMLDTALKAMNTGSSETLKELKLHDQRLNAYQSAIQGYLSELTERTLTADEAHHAIEMVLYVSNLEHAGDIIQLNLADRIKAKLREGHAFTDADQKALDELCAMIHNNVRMAAAVLSSRDVDGAQALIAQKDAFRVLENRIIHEQVRSKGAGKGKAMRRSALFIDLLRDLHRLNSHVVSAGYPIVDAAGLLRSTRLRKNSRP
jgi:phosphate:Na+ symporter